MSDHVLVDIADRVATITVNDPDRRNAVTADISRALRAAVEAAEADPQVHAVIVTGAGKAFCAGADLTALGEAAEDGLRVIYDGFLAVANCTLPTIAAVNGAAVGAGDPMQSPLFATAPEVGEYTGDPGLGWQSVSNRRAMVEMKRFCAFTLVVTGRNNGGCA